MHDFFRGLDHIHTNDAWKQAVYDRIEQPMHQRHPILRYAIVLILLAIISTGAVIAKNDAVKQWLQDLFTPPVQEEPKVKAEDPPTVPAAEAAVSANVQEQIDQEYVITKELPDKRCWINKQQTIYASQSCEEMQQQDRVAVADVNVVEQILQRQHMETTVTFEQQAYPVAFDYLLVHDSIYPFEAANAEVGLRYVKSYAELPNHVVINIKSQDAMNEFLLDMTTGKTTSIGNLDLKGRTASAQTVRKFAYDTHVSKNGSFLLYRSSLVQGTWVDRKEEQVWIVQNTNTGEEEILKDVPGGLIGNEITFIDDEKILTIRSDKRNTGSVPITYDCVRKEWTLHEGYPYTENQQVTGMLLHQKNDSYTLLDLHTMQSTTYGFPFEKGDRVLPYPAYDVIVQQSGRFKGIYLRQQHRYVQLKEEDQNRVRSIDPLDETHVLFDWRYVVTLN